MGNRTAKFISALVGSIIAGAPLAAVSQNAPTATSPANAASDCLASPKGAAPQGQHWHYRLERATKRQCWYLRAEGGKVTQTAQAAPDTPTAESAAPQPQSVQDARAEYLTPQGAVVPKTTAQPAPTQQAASPTADSSAQQSAVAARWADTSSTTTASPAPQAAPAPVAAATQPSAKPSKSPVALAAADSSTDKPTGSIQMLLLVIGGALALAGILASIVYRFAGGRVRVQTDHRRVNWDNFEPHALDDGRAPWLNATAADAPRAQQPRPVDFDAARPQAPKPQAPQPQAAPPQAPDPQAARPQAAQLAAFSIEIGRIAAQSRPAPDEVADELDEADIFNGEFEIEASAPRLAVNGINDEEPTDRDEDAQLEEDLQLKEDLQLEDAVDVDVITAMLERLAQEGPRLKQPSPEADLADFARTPRGQSAARA
ncbi:hypothetical protein I3J27_16595 [Bradyrhizobium xenonodulans]|uniref:Uncharacterized protein n=1 Tax=Bradyrhizobium xenonodulans TaxID=2736875 RepID=A0ABY7MUD1_9BRAD|nr:hypothetical protein [Bradyrhizobium xenonodulans]WBL81958.1 hypothetical protein I3J27_16595 [Bradyrhizobium xenonodulans]